MAEAEPQTPLPLPAAPRIVLYDGVCGFCDGFVRWLLAHDRVGRLWYAALQGETAAALRARHPEIPEAIDSVVFIESDGEGERVYLNSSAVFRIARQLGAPWRWLAHLGRLPRGLTDAVYRVVVRHRYRLFGRLESCRIPQPSERARFLDA